MKDDTVDLKKNMKSNIENQFDISNAAAGTRKEMYLFLKAAWQYLKFYAKTNLNHKFA